MIAWKYISFSGGNKYTVNAPGGMGWDREFEWAMDKIKELNIECPTIMVGIGYTEQCNFEFSADELKKITDTGGSLIVSCYRT